MWGKECVKFRQLLGVVGELYILYDMYAKVAMFLLDKCKGRGELNGEKKKKEGMNWVKFVFWKKMTMKNGQFSKWILKKEAVISCKNDLDALLVL